MWKPVLLVFCLLGAPGAAPATERPDPRECEKVKEEIRRIQARMRRGYGAAEGVQLNERLLRLRERRAKICR